MGTCLVSGFGNTLRIRAYGLGFGCVFVKSISNAGMHESFGTVHPAGQ